MRSLQLYVMKPYHIQEYTDGEVSYYIHRSIPIMEEDTDLDFSFTSCASASTSTATDRTFHSSSARSSLTLSFNESRLSTTSTTASTSLPFRPHRSSDPNWSAVKAATTLSSDGKLHLRHLKLIHHIGTGNLGRVFLCRLRDNDHGSFALKVVDKESLNSKKLSHVLMEGQILSMLDHPFLPTLYAHFDVSHYTCFLIDYCSGGDLHSLLRKQPGNRFSLSAVRFFAAEVLVALEYLHSLGIVYRDLKPENILLRSDGHIMLSDFDLCFRADVVPAFHTRFQSRSRHSSCFTSPIERTEISAEFIAEPTAAFSNSCVGTHEYLAPELASGRGHGNGVDWWAFGVLIYELLYGMTPFKGESKERTLRNITSGKRVRFPATETEEHGMAEARDLITRLLTQDPRRRLGCEGGATEIKRHPFFAGIKWPLIRTYRPPDVRGGVRKRKKASVGQKRRRWFSNWKRVGDFVRSRKASMENNNGNYYHYVTKHYKPKTNT